MTILRTDNTNIDITLFENTVFRQKRFNILELLRELLAPISKVREKFWRQILVYTARTEIIGVHARAAGALIKDHKFFALFKAPNWRGQRTNIHRLRRDIEHMRKNAANFGIKHADELRAARHANARQLFNRKTKGMLLVHRRDVIEAVQIRQRLQIGLMLHQLFRAAMQQANMRVDALNNLAL